MYVSTADSAPSRPVTKRSVVTTWIRRCVSIPLVTTCFIGAWLTLPITLSAAFVYDIAQGTKFAACRTLTFFLHFLTLEAAGMVASFFLWLVSGIWLGANRAWFLRKNFQLQCWWGSSLAAGGLRIFRGSFNVELDYDFGRRPIIVMMRHVSFADTVLPAYYISKPYGIQLRYVLKQELLWDPCLDIVGNRLPNGFVHRFSDDRSAEIARVGGLMKGLTPNEGVLIYPEGTRFSPDKRTRIINRFREKGDTAAAERAEMLKHVLPPRLGGPLELLGQNEGCDVVFGAHAGMESTARFGDVIRGGLVGNVAHIRFWGVPFEDIPKDPEAQAAWLHEQWRKVDDFVDKHIQKESK